MTTATALRVEIGPGKQRIGPDWVTVGVEEVDYKCLWGVQTLPFEDASVDEIYACHVIEHVPWWLVGNALDDAFRILKPGGEIEVHTIDFGKVVEFYREGKSGDNWDAKKGVPEGEFMFWVASRIFSHGSDYGDPQWHKALFDRPYLRRMLHRSGFTQVVSVAAPRKGENHGVANMGMKAVKP